MAVKKEYEAFSAIGYKAIGTGEEFVSIKINNGYDPEYEARFSVEEALEVLHDLRNAIQSAQDAEIVTFEEARKEWIAEFGERYDPTRRYSRDEHSHQDAP